MNLQTFPEKLALTFYPASVADVLISVKIMGLTVRE